jgi:hypothetical protein
VGIEGATLTVLLHSSPISRVLTDTAGWFSLTLPDSGTYQLEAQRLGYATTRSQPLFVNRYDTLTVEFRVQAEAVALAPLVVTGRSPTGWSQFYGRMSDWGRGIFMTPEMVDSINPRHPADVFRGQEETMLTWRWGLRSAIPSVRTFLGRGCVAYMLDRKLMEPRFWGSIWEDSPLGWVTGKEVVAVEYYRYIGEVPPELRQLADVDDHMCGLVVFWTAAGW